MLALNILIYIISFVVIWFGAGLIISAVSRFSKKFKLSSFAISFVLLGLLTSTPEFAVGVQSIAEHNPEIFVGNLLGGIPVILLFVIPLLAIFGNGVSLKHELDHSTLLATLAVILTPSLLVLDKRVSNVEGVVLIILYFVLLLLVEKKHGFFDRANMQLLNTRTFSLNDLVKILVGIGLVFISSNLIVDKTLYFAELLQISAFYISLIAIAIGTNLPELSLAVRAVATGKKDIAMGDYMGSAAANTFLFGLFTLLNNGEVLTINNFVVTFVFILTAIMIFYVLSRTKNFISRGNGFLMLIVYFAFVTFEFLR
jgi:cation:H+ antiporter